MSIIDDMWDAHQRKIGATKDSTSDSLREIARELSLRYPVSPVAVYRSLVNLIDAFEVAIQLSATTGQDASFLMEHFVSNATRGLSE